MIRTKDTFFEKISVRDPKTVDAYRKRIKIFERFLTEKNIPFDDLRGDDLYDILQSYINWLHKDHAPSTISNYFTSIRKYLHYMRVNITSDDVEENLELPKKIEKELHPLKLSEILRIFENLRYVDQCLFLCMLSSGMRIGEITQLRKRDLIMGDRIIVKIPSRIAKFKRGRTTIFSVEVGVRIAPILKKLQDDDLIFGTSDNNKEQILRNSLDKCGLDMRYDDTGNYQINTHSFRAYFVTKVSRHDPNIAKKMSGEKGYLLQYDRLSEDELLVEYLKFEPDLLIYEKQVTDGDKMKKLEDRIDKLKIENEKTVENMVRKVIEKYFKPIQN